MEADDVAGPAPPTGASLNRQPCRIVSLTHRDALEQILLAQKSAVEVTGLRTHRSDPPHTGKGWNQQKNSGVT